MIAADGIICHCSDCQEFNGNTTCLLKSEGKCFSSVELDHDGAEMYSFGCLPPDEGTILQVRTFDFPILFCSYPLVFVYVFFKTNCLRMDGEGILFPLISLTDH